MNVTKWRMRSSNSVIQLTFLVFFSILTVCNAEDENGLFSTHNASILTNASLFSNEVESDLLSSKNNENICDGMTFDCSCLNKESENVKKEDKKSKKLCLSEDCVMAASTILSSLDRQTGKKSFNKADKLFVTFNLAQ